MLLALLRERRSYDAWSPNSHANQICQALSKIKIRQISICALCCITLPGHCSGSSPLRCGVPRQFNRHSDIRSPEKKQNFKCNET